MDYASALRYLDDHINLEAMAGRSSRPEPPTLERITRLVNLLGDPQHAAPVIHLTGTNGKGSTAQITTRLLAAHGLRVGTYTSPHLQRVNERISRNGEPISDDELAEMIAAVADAEVLAGIRPSYFEILTAAAFRWFADVAVDVVVLEVGMLGRWDATNVADGSVAVVTNVGFDHIEYAGATRLDIAAEKAGIVKPGATLVLGETDEEVTGPFERSPAAKIHRRDDHFAVIDNRLALGGRLLDLRTPEATYAELFLPLHGAYQAENASLALCAVEDFFERPVGPDVVAEAFAELQVPGRLEVVGHQPLVVLDCAHNIGGAAVLADALNDEFDAAGETVLVVGLLHGRDPFQVLEALGATDARLVIATTAPSPRAIPAEEIALAAGRLGTTAVAVDRVDAALERGFDEVGPDDVLVVTGSFTVVGAARTLLGRT